MGLDGKMHDDIVSGIIDRLRVHKKKKKRTKDDVVFSSFEEFMRTFFPKQKKEADLLKMMFGKCWNGIQKRYVTDLHNITQDHYITYTSDNSWDTVVYNHREDKNEGFMGY